MLIQSRWNGNAFTSKSRNLMVKTMKFTVKMPWICMFQMLIWIQMNRLTAIDHMAFNQLNDDGKQIYRGIDTMKHMAIQQTSAILAVTTQHPPPPPQYDSSSTDWLTTRYRVATLLCSLRPCHSRINAKFIIWNTKFMIWIQDSSQSHRYLSLMLLIALRIYTHRIQLRRYYIIFTCMTPHSHFNAINREISLTKRVLSLVIVVKNDDFCSENA